MQVRHRGGGGPCVLRAFALRFQGVRDSEGLQCRVGGSGFAAHLLGSVGRLQEGISILLSVLCLFSPARS